MRLFALALMASTILAPPVLAQKVQAPVPVAKLIKQVNIPHEKFTLPNGLRVIVQDRKSVV